MTTALAGPLPDHTLTPGVTNPAATKELICKPGYTQGRDVRHVTLAMKKQVFARYRILWGEHAKYEVDHLVSLELGGSNEVRNLWPEPWDPRPGAHEKDQVENELHREVCSGKLALEAAQHIIATDWLAFYREMKR